MISDHFKSLIYSNTVIYYESLSSDEDKQAFEAWHAHDDAEENFCELDGEQCTRSTFVF